MIVALGVDLGLREGALAVVEIEGLTARAVDMMRLRNLTDAEFQQTVETAIQVREPNVIGIEKPFGGGKPNVTQGQAGRAALVQAAAERAGVPVFRIPPSRVKKAIAGHGWASKEQMQSAVTHLFAVDLRRHGPAAEHLADAVAVAATAGRYLLDARVASEAGTSDGRPAKRRKTIGGANRD